MRGTRGLLEETVHQDPQAYATVQRVPGDLKRVSGEFRTSSSFIYPLGGSGVSKVSIPTLKQVRVKMRATWARS